MSDSGQTFDIFTADHGGLMMLADGGDLFDPSHLTAADATTDPAVALSGDPLHLHAPVADTLDPLLLADASDPVPSAPTQGHAPHAATAETTEAPVPQADGHGPALTLDDVLSDAAQDLASFHTAAGPAGASHQGSASFEPFAPAPQLGGLTELHVIHPD